MFIPEYLTHSFRSFDLNIPDQVDPSVPDDIDPLRTGSNCPLVPGQTDPSGIRFKFGSFRTKLTPLLGTEI